VLLEHAEPYASVVEGADEVSRHVFAAQLHPVELPEGLLDVPEAPREALDPARQVGEETQRLLELNPLRPSAFSEVRVCSGDLLADGVGEPHVAGDEPYLVVRVAPELIFSAGVRVEKPLVGLGRLAPVLLERQVHAAAEEVAPRLAREHPRVPALEDGPVVAAVAFGRLGRNHQYLRLQSVQAIHLLHGSRGVANPLKNRFENRRKPSLEKSFLEDSPHAIEGHLLRHLSQLLFDLPADALRDPRAAQEGDALDGARKPRDGEVRRPHRRDVARDVHLRVQERLRRVDCQPSNSDFWSTAVPDFREPEPLSRLSRTSGVGGGPGALLELLPKGPEGSPRHVDDRLAARLRVCRGTPSALPGVPLRIA